jgi:hypothetical protein
MKEIIIIEGKEVLFEIKDKNRSEPWKVNFVFPKRSLSSLITSDDQLNQLKSILERWNETWLKIAPEKNVAQMFGKGSLIVRIDYTIDYTLSSQKKIFVYEIEDSPAGIGLATLSIEGFKEKLNNLGWEKVVVIVPSSKKGGDDYLWTHTIDETEISKLDSSNWIAPRVNSLPCLKEKSIWPLAFKESKRYLVEMGLAEYLEITNLSESEKEIEKKINEYANKRKAFGIVFKSDGARAERVRLIGFKRLIKEIIEWVGEANTGGIGLWSLKAIEKEIMQWNSIYLQELVPPLRVILNGKKMYGICRIFFGYSIKNKQWILLGGFLNLRKSLVIHGASDSFFVPIPA